MARIIEILGCDNKVSYANVHVLLDDGTEGICYVGGDCEVYFDPNYNKIKVFIKKKKGDNGLVNGEASSKNLPG